MTRLSPATRFRWNARWVWLRQTMWLWGVIFAGSVVFIWIGRVEEQSRKAWEQVPLQATVGYLTGVVPPSGSHGPIINTLRFEWQVSQGKATGELQSADVFVIGQKFRLLYKQNRTGETKLIRATLLSR